MIIIFLGSWQKPSSIAQPTAAVDRLAQNNFSTVAIIAVTDDVPLTAFTYELYHSVSAIGKVYYFFIFYSSLFKYLLDFIFIRIYCLR